MTVYAAFQASRAAVVYNPADYKGGTGPVFDAAHTVLRMLYYGKYGKTKLELWPNKSVANENAPLQNQMLRNNSSSGNLATTESESDDDISDLINVRLEENLTYSWVKATVSFNFPLVVPFVNRIFGEKDSRVVISKLSNSTSSSRLQVVEKFKEASIRSGYYLTLTETSIMPKLISTEGFPTIPQ